MSDRPLVVKRAQSSSNGIQQKARLTKKQGPKTKRSERKKYGLFPWHVIVQNSWQNSLQSKGLKIANQLLWRTKNWSIGLFSSKFWNRAKFSQVVAAFATLTSSNLVHEYFLCPPAVTKYCFADHRPAKNSAYFKTLFYGSYSAYGWY